MIHTSPALHVLICCPAEPTEIVRTFSVKKGGFMFAASSQVPKLTRMLDKKVLSARTPCIDMSEGKLTGAIVAVHVEMVLVYPFRKGNGRLPRLLASVMTLQAGWPKIDFALGDERKADYFAANRAELSDCGPMKGLVRRALRQSKRNADE